MYSSRTKSNIMDASSSLEDGDTVNPYNATPVEKIHSLLNAKDDTSRFVGLALLKSVLDNGQFAQDPEQLHKLWEGVPPKFLDRLLRAKRNEKINQAEAQNMVDLATAVLHTFTIILSENFQREKRMIGRVEPLVNALIESPPKTAELILQTLLTIVSHPEGALEMLKIGDLSPLTEISVQHVLVLDILDYMWANSAASSHGTDSVRKSINRNIPTLQIIFEGTDAVTLVKFLGDFLPKLAPKALPQDPLWLKPIVSTLRKLVINRPTLAGRTAYTQLASSLLQIYPATCPFLLFEDDGPRHQASKPFSYLFVNLLLIDIRSSFPTLLSQLNSPEYPATSQRLSAAFDVISSFIGFLVRSLDDDSGAFSMPPDFLLKLRKEIAETMSLNIEYLRDRWDASVAGAAGLHPAARTGTAATSEGTRLTLTWDSMKDDVRADPLILAGIRALAIWVREDENENLRNEAAGIMDMLVELYKSHKPEALDFRYPVLLALEGVLDTDDGVASFLEQNGWEIAAEDLDSIQQHVTREELSHILSTKIEATRGLEVVRVLLAVIDHPSTSIPQEDWMAIVNVAASMKLPPAGSAIIILEFQISMLQLATALVSKAAGGMQRRYITSIAPLSGLARQLEDMLDDNDDKLERTELVDLLEDVRLELENLR